MKHAAERALPAVLTLFALGLAGLYPIDNPDTFGHMATGRQIVSLGRVPTLDTFSYFRPEPTPYVNYEWLSDALFFVVYRAGGAPGLNLMKVALLWVLGALLLCIGFRRAGRLGTELVALFVVAGLPGLRFRLSVRPQLFGLVFGALYLLGLQTIAEAKTARHRWAWVAGLALAHAVWVNLHGSHLLGLAFIAIACISARRDVVARVPLCALLGLALLASCASPYGPAILSGAIAHVFDPAYRAVIEEWQAWQPTQSLWYPAVLLWESAWIGFALLHLRAERRFLFDAFTGLMLLLMAARSLRFIADCVALSAPLIAAGIAPRMAAMPDARRTPILRAAQALACVLALFICPQLPPGARMGIGERTEGRPAASGRWLAAHLPQARILAVMSDAWDLMFTLPNAQFLLDGRTPLYGPEHIRRVQRAWGSGSLLRTLIDETRTDVVIAQPMVKEQQPALQALLGFRDFRLLVIEDRHCLFARELPAREPWLRAAALTTLVPGYAVDWVLGEPLDLDQVARELARLPAHPNVRAYRAWVAALVALKPLARGGGRAGIAWPQTAAERRITSGALSLLREVDRELEIVPTVAVYHALTAVAACELDEAREAFARAETTGRVREATFGEQELSLRAGELAPVRDFLQRVRALPEAARDPWVAALEAELEAPTRCSDEAP